MKKLFALLLILLFAAPVFAQNYAPLINPPGGQNNYAPLDHPTLTGLVTVIAGNGEHAELKSPTVDATSTLVAPSGTWTAGGLNLRGLFTFDGVPMGGKCPSGEFVDALSASGLLTCVAPAGGGVSVGATPPSNPVDGQLWFNSTDLQTYIWYIDPTSSQWVPVVNYQKEFAELRAEIKSLQQEKKK